MIERLQDYKVKLRVDGQIHNLTVLSRTPNASKLEAIRKARRLLETDLIEFVSVKVKKYRPYV